jgi:hypothetical protein
MVNSEQNHSEGNETTQQAQMSLTVVLRPFWNGRTRPR